jgi:hypothetical protein
MYRNVSFEKCLRCVTTASPQVRRCDHVLWLPKKQRINTCDHQQLAPQWVWKGGGTGVMGGRGREGGREDKKPERAV